MAWGRKTARCWSIGPFRIEVSHSHGGIEPKVRLEMKLGVECRPRSKRDDDDHVILPEAVDCTNRPIELDSVHQLRGCSGVRATSGQCRITDRSMKRVVLLDDEIRRKRLRARAKMRVEEACIRQPAAGNLGPRGLLSKHARGDLSKQDQGDQHAHGDAPGLSPDVPNVEHQGCDGGEANSGNSCVNSARV